MTTSRLARLAPLLLLLPTAVLAAREDFPEFNRTQALVRSITTSLTFLFIFRAGREQVMSSDRYRLRRGGSRRARAPSLVSALTLSFRLVLAGPP